MVLKGIAFATAVVLVVGVSQVQSNRGWVLPVADGGDVDPSPPSFRGYINRVTKERLNVVAEDKRGSSVEARLTPRTEFFTAYGGAYDADDLRLGQYVWVWYITADAKKAGTPPQAAVVILWSKDPKDRPSDEVRSHYDRRK